MVAVAQQTNIVMDTQGDEVRMGLVISLIRFVPDTGSSVAGDRVVLTDPVTSDILWEGTVEGATIPISEPQASGTNNRTWPNGATLSTLTGNRGTLYLRY